MSSVDLPELGAGGPGGARGCGPPTLGARLPETDDWLQRILALDFTTYMPGSVLTKVDRASMAHGLEVRPPLLDDALVDCAFSLPSRYKLPRGGRASTCSSARRAGRSPTRSSIGPRRGSGSRWRAWLRGPLAARLEEVVAESPLWELGLLDRAVFAGWQTSTASEGAIAASRCGRSTCSITGCARLDKTSPGFRS